MAISGRVPLLVLLGLVPVVLRPTFGTMWLWLLAVALVVAVDFLLAPRPEVLEISRRPTDPVRLGRPTSTTLVVANPSGRTRHRAAARRLAAHGRSERQPVPDPAHTR